MKLYVRALNEYNIKQFKKFFESNKYLFLKLDMDSLCTVIEQNSPIPCKVQDISNLSEDTIYVEEIMCGVDKVDVQISIG